MLLSKLVSAWKARRWRSPHIQAWSDDLSGDEFVEHLGAVVGGWLVKGNIAAVDYAVKHLPASGAVVEIGAFLGLSTNLLVYALVKNRPEARLFSCDPFVFAGSERPKAGYFSTGSADYRRWVMDHFKRTLSLFHPGREPFAIEAPSRRFFQAWAASQTVADLFGREVVLGGPIGFAYVDGDHTYRAVREDFEQVDRFLLPGGLVFFDDSSDNGAYPGVRQLMTEIQASPRYQLLMKTPNYLFQRRAR